MKQSSDGTSIDTAIRVSVECGSDSSPKCFGETITPAPLHGVNLAGAEFTETRLPGQFGRDYVYPNNKELDYYKQKGFDSVRLPIRWERIQHQLFGDLDRTEMARVDSFVSAASARNLKVILDLHNYGRYQGNRIGLQEVPTKAFADVWTKLASRYKKNEGVFAFDLMNEPHGTHGRWPGVAQAGVDAIRSVDRNHYIFVAGDDWSSSMNWERNNADLKIRDPANKIVYEAHCYFDGDSSGKYRESYPEQGAYADLGVDHVRPFVQWLRKNHASGFVGEFGFPSGPEWAPVAKRFLNYLDRNGVGSAAWAGGPWWGDYNLSLEPSGGRDKPQTKLLERHNQELEASRKLSNHI